MFWKEGTTQETQHFYHRYQKLETYVESSHVFSQKGVILAQLISGQKRLCFPQFLASLIKEFRNGFSRKLKNSFVSVGEKSNRENKLQGEGRGKEEERTCGLFIKGDQPSHHVADKQQHGGNRSGEYQRMNEGSRGSGKVCSGFGQKQKRGRVLFS